MAVDNSQSDIENLLCSALVEGKLMFDSASSIATKTLCFDCRQMQEPCDQSLRNHLGTHPRLLSEFAADPAMRVHLLRFRDEVEKCRKHGVTNIRLLVYDRHGRWAAMALGKVFAEIALRSEGLTLQKVSFLLHFLETDCKGCKDCAFWSWRSVSSNDAVKSMWKLYEGSAAGSTKP